MYNDPRIYAEEMRADKMLSALYEYYGKNPDKMPEFYRTLLDSYDKDTVLCDYISGMSDGFAVKTFSGIFIPNKWEL